MRRRRFECLRKAALVCRDIFNDVGRLRFHRSRRELLQTLGERAHLFGQSSPRIADERATAVTRAPRLFMLRNGQRAKNLSDFLPNTTTDLSRVYASLSLPGLRDVRVGNPVPARSTQTPKHERHSTGEKSHSHIVTRRATPQHATGRLPSRPWLLARRRASHHTHAQLAPPIHHNSFQRVCSSLLREQTSTSNAVRAGPWRER